MGILALQRGEDVKLEELSEKLADATGKTIGEIERGAEELEIAPPSEATVIDE